jgi:phosphatidylglycerol:prolipoprotein diacylglycerol transferase
VIPYFPQPVWIVGPFTIHAFGVLAALALLIGYWLVLTRAVLFGIDREFSAKSYVFVAFSGLLIGWLWNGLRGEHGISGTGLGLGGCVTLSLVAISRKPQFWRVLDLFAYVFPLVLAIARVGCFLAHDHIGAPTNLWIGVRFPEGTRSDLGLLYALAAGATAVVVVWLNYRKPPAGVLFAATMALLGASRLAILGAGGPALSDSAVAAGEVVLALLVLAFRARVQAVSAPLG